MASATFILKEPTSKEPTLLYLVFRYGGEKFKYSTGQKINPKFWNKEKHRAKETRLFPEYPEFNATLDKIETIVFNTYRKAINDKIKPVPELFRNELDVFLQKKGEGLKADLISFSESFVDGSSRKPATKKQQRQAIRNLKEFKAASKRSMDFETIDLEFYDDFLKFLTDKKYGINSIGTIVKNLKVFLNEAVERGLTQNLQFKNRRFKTMEEPSESIYLTEQEIEAIYKLDLSANTKLDRVRDLFIIGCYTGLRYSDLVQLRNENLIENGQMVKVKTEKTGETVIIPLHDYIKEILIKYNGIPPETISNQKMNDYLKELGKLAELNQQSVISYTKGGEKFTELFEKWELITVHTARRSFATNAYLQDVPTISIMKITGHRTEKSFLKYIKISQQDNANKLLNHPFFRTKSESKI